MIIFDKICPVSDSFSLFRRYIIRSKERLQAMGQMSVGCVKGVNPYSFLFFRFVSIVCMISIIRSDPMASKSAKPFLYISSA